MSQQTTPSGASGSPTPQNSSGTVATPEHRRTFLRPSRLLANAPLEKLHPAVLAEAEKRASSVQLRIADAITAFAGSMNFVYLHIVLFAVWMLVFEKSPWPTLTLIVSLEAIFLSTFVMISQNRQAGRADVRSELDFENNLRSEIWAVHIGTKLGIDAAHVEAVVAEALRGARSEGG